MTPHPNCLSRNARSKHSISPFSRRWFRSTRWKPLSCSLLDEIVGRGRQSLGGWDSIAVRHFRMFPWRDTFGQRLHPLQNDMPAIRNISFHTAPRKGNDFRDPERILSPPSDAYLPPHLSRCTNQIPSMDKAVRALIQFAKDFDKENLFVKKRCNTCGGKKNKKVRRHRPRTLTIPRVAARTTFSGIRCRCRCQQRTCRGMLLRQVGILTQICCADPSHQDVRRPKGIAPHWSKCLAALE
jgi:hypothetical protein